MIIKLWNCDKLIYVCSPFLIEKGSWCSTQHEYFDTFYNLCMYFFESRKCWAKWEEQGSDFKSILLHKNEIYKKCLNCLTSVASVHLESEWISERDMTTY